MEWLIPQNPSGPQWGPSLQSSLLLLLLPKKGGREEEKEDEEEEGEEQWEKEEEEGMCKAMREVSDTIA